MANRALVLDANIPIRAVLGTRVRRLLEKHADSVSFFVPESAYMEAEEHYWPILACALALHCPIWTEDTDFFGCGAATWTSNNIEIFLGG